MRAFFVPCFVLALVACGSKSGLNDPGPSDAGGIDARLPDGGFRDLGTDAGDTLMVDCGRHNRYTSPGRPIAITVMVTGTDPAPREGWAPGAGPPGSRPVVTSVADTFGITPDVDGDYPVHFDVTDRSANHATCDYVVHSVTGPPIAICPESDLTGRPNMPVRVDGAGYDDVRVVSYAWAITAGPMARESLMPTDMPVTEFQSDTGGRYDLTLTVTDDTGATGSCVAHVNLTNGPTVMCPMDGIHAHTRQPLTLTGMADEGGAALTTNWAIERGPVGSMASLVPPTGLTTTFTPDLVGMYVIDFTATDASGLSAMCRFTVIVDPSPPTVTCPAEIDTTPLSTVDITATVVADFPVATYAWTLTSEPPGSGAMSPTPPNAMTTHFTPDVAGDYHVTVLVTDSSGLTGTCTTDVRAAASEGLRVELYWNPPDNSCKNHPGEAGCDGSDVDLHLLNPIATSWVNENDCYFGNCSTAAGEELEWGAPGPLNDPHLDLDTTNGFGPENTNIDVPVPGMYTVGVHYWSDHTVGNTAACYVNIYCGVGSTTPVASFGPVVLHGNLDPSANDFWRVANLTVGGGTCTVSPITAPGGGPVINPESDLTSMR